MIKLTQIIAWMAVMVSGTICWVAVALFGIKISWQASPRPDVYLDDFQLVNKILLGSTVSCLVCGTIAGLLFVLANRVQNGKISKNDVLIGFIQVIPWMFLVAGVISVPWSIYHFLLDPPNLFDSLYAIPFGLGCYVLLMSMVGFALLKYFFLKGKITGRNWWWLV